MALPRPSEKPDQFVDAHVVGDAARGSPDALAALYSRYAKELLALAYRLLQTRQDAEDVDHDVFVGLPEALRRYEERGSLGPWLRKITARVALMRLREQRARPLVELDERRVRASANVQHTALTIEQALRALSPNLRAVVVLKEIEGFTHAEIPHARADRAAARAHTRTARRVGSRHPAGAPDGARASTTARARRDRRRRRRIGVSRAVGPPRSEHWRRLLCVIGVPGARGLCTVGGS